MKEREGIEEMEQREEACAGRMAAVGMFDGVHLGHRYLLGHLRRLAGEAGLQPMVLTFANHPLSVIAPERAPRLLTSPEEKRALIEGAGVACEVIPFTEELRFAPAEEFMRMLSEKYGVRALLMGYNNRFGHNGPRDFEAYRRMGAEHGIEVMATDEFVPDSGLHVSSTEIRRLLAEGDVATANALLGREYTLRGTVEEGHQLGRSIGFPTANLRPDMPERLVPAPGVYATEALGHKAMTNIGVRPTVDRSASPRVTIETHILGCDTDLYGQTLELAFRRYIRPERRFETIDDLACQLAADRREAMR